MKRTARVKLTMTTAEQRLGQVWDALKPKSDTGLSPLCSFDELPAVDRMPHGCAWNYYPKDKSKRDQLGRLNLLTADHVRQAAASEIKTGERVQLDWRLDNVQFPGFKRRKFEQTVIDKSNPTTGWIGTDDEIALNTQSGSQWDGFRHVGHQLTGLYYNGLTHKEIISGDKTNNGIDNWCKAGGIAGRAVLLDWLRWRRETKPDSPDLSPIERIEVPHEELEDVARYQGVELRFGDILLIRTGFVAWHNQASEDERRRGTFEQALFIGIKATEEAVRWFWDKHFAAVGGDTVAFEAWPPIKGKPCLHEWFLSQWGMPIGEMWDLESLSEVCKKHQRWSFFLTSSPLNVPGGVGSPPNAMAIF